MTSGGAQCPVCYSTDMQWHGGSLSCMVCGSQSQVSSDSSPTHHPVPDPLKSQLTVKASRQNLRAVLWSDMLWHNDACSNLQPSESSGSAVVSPCQIMPTLQGAAVNP